MSAFRAHGHTLRGAAQYGCPARSQPGRRVLSTPRSTAVHTASELVDWLRENGAKIDAVEVKTMDVPSAGRPLDVVVAGRSLAAGEVALSVPERLCLTLDRIFESEFVAELLTTDKLSELACLALYLMYEKKLKKKSFWYPYIKELDKQQARGPQAAESPLLWGDQELDSLLKGSPLLPAVRQRQAGIRKEYEALDTVWFMAGSLFNKYPFDLPTETFSFELFQQAFAVVQASIVHLQGVPIAKRFALVPLGPPLMAYSSTSKNMMTYDEDSRSVRLVVSGPVEAGRPVAAWCGPQPNSRLLLNYGVVDEHNPFDKLQARFTFTLPTSDPLFPAKRAVLSEAGLATQQSFDVSVARPLPPQLLPYMMLALATTPEQVASVSFSDTAGHDRELEAAALAALMAYVQRRTAAYAHPLWRDLEIINDPSSTPRQKVAARLTKIEKSILAAAAEALAVRGAPTDATALGAAAARLAGAGVRMGSLQDGQGHCG
ncbi:hypothetical protein VOLCADRAFT_76643 [Volvox carteri f. nagariensis]|uniref:Rubisco LSMT substrate-binding domain-containing protein n=1 Tax=Volvox carteri f. nagariensis TaxID=3068 RepID=D8U9E8_VOLCA|nr:uncharacterized protein VOLCADRAFT_76643 [Volvox carteri f. nagariensis]EFJ43572.1 hypothetical protein VOLCADRAFT_76643 [Volvox carteri f. nagariensis]|eukprot:XP_002955272.1 hypothetical protein VOLCADRAFT_76643 [Volvox carteri f. nagariensis]